MGNGVLTVEKPEIAMNINRLKDNSGIRFSEKKQPTRATIEAMGETLQNIKSGNLKVFYDVDEFMNDLLADYICAE
jgi:hypothetical protein